MVSDDEFDRESLKYLSKDCEMYRVHLGRITLRPWLAAAVRQLSDIALQSMIHRVGVRMQYMLTGRKFPKIKFAKYHANYRAFHALLDEKDRRKGRGRNAR